jgi:hypothetical protein
MRNTHQKVGKNSNTPNKIDLTEIYILRALSSSIAKIIEY